MVDAAVSYAIEKLGDFLIQEVNIRIGLKDAVLWLKNELGYLQVSVRTAETKHEVDHIRLWVNNVKDVANEAVIILERFSANQEKHAVKKKGVLDCLGSCICICKKEADLYDIGKEIESLKKRFEDIKKSRDEYHINDILTTPNVHQRKRTLLRATSFENQVDVIGFEDDFKILLAELLKELDSSLGMISIHGMGGLGKSTLASKLYHSSELSHFGHRAWVCVSEDYNIKDVLKKIIKSFTGSDLDLSNCDEVDLLRHLRKLLLKGEHFLVVIDDIWDIDVWEKIKKAFPDKNNGSRVVITTRNKKVAQRVDDKCYVHQLRFLKVEESWQLFCKRAKPTKNLEMLGEEMVSKCRGLPLAIIVLSGLLLHKKSYEGWLEVKDHLWKQLKGDSMEIEEILSLSYDDLSFQMKQCFLYLARYPEDQTFEVDKLMQLWIAEEFISEADEGDGVVMEDVAKDYLNELINRNMIQIEILQFNGKVLACRIHDLLRELAIQKAKEQKLLGMFESSKQQTTSIQLLQGQPRHAIYNGIGEYMNLIEPSCDDLKLRSLALIMPFGGPFRFEVINMIYSRFKYLKVLDLTSIKSGSMTPKEIGDLELLKFLGLMGGGTEQLLVIPQTIGKLKKLQTLRGSRYSRYEFPEEICELKDLRHLIFQDNFKEAGRGSLRIGSQQSKIQTLNNICYEDWIQIDTVNLTNLQTLVITDYRREEKIAAYNFESMANLTSLRTFYHQVDTILPTMKPLSSCKHLTTVVLLGTIKDPSELCFLPDSVTCLSLAGSELTQGSMPILGSLSNLISLNLDPNSYTGVKIVCSQNAFPCLQLLRIERLYNLEELQVEEGALPALRGFRILDCKKIKTISSQLQCIPDIPDRVCIRNDFVRSLI